MARDSGVVPLGSKQQQPFAEAVLLVGGSKRPLPAPVLLAAGAGVRGGVGAHAYAVKSTHCFEGTVYTDGRDVHVLISATLDKGEKVSGYQCQPQSGAVISYLVHTNKANEIRQH